MFNPFKKKKLAEALDALTSVFAEDAPVKEYSESEVKVSDKVAGGKVELVGADGSLTPAPDGDFKIAGDDNVYTAKDGVITAINGEAPKEEAPKEEVPVEAAAPAEADEPNEPAPGTPEDEVEDDQELEDLKAQVAALTQAVADLQAQLAGAAKQDDVAQFSAQLIELNETIKKAMNIPAEFSKTNTSNVIKDSNKEAAKSLRELFKVKS